MDLRYVSEKVGVLLKVPPVVECVLNTPVRQMLLPHTTHNEFCDSVYDAITYRVITNQASVRTDVT